VGFVLHDLGTSKASLTLTGIDPSEVSRYENYFSTTNPWLKRSPQFLAVDNVHKESTAKVIAAVREVIERKGLFCALYSDRGSHFFLTPKAGAKVDPHRVTQLGRALRDVGVQAHWDSAGVALERIPKSIMSNNNLGPRWVHWLPNTEENDGKARRTNLCLPAPKFFSPGPIVRAPFVRASHRTI
jgi:hypothetical protein